MTPASRPVILTRPAGRNHALARRLQAHGVATLALPALVLAPLSCDAGALPRPNDYDLVVFVSGAAARAYAEQLQHIAHLSQWPAHVPAACVGPATARALRGPFWPPTLRILHPAAEAPRHDSEALWQVLQAVLPGIQRVLIVRGATGREWLSERLSRAAIDVARHAAYQRQAAAWPDAAQQRLAQWHGEGATPVWLVTSTASLDALHAHIARADWLAWWRSHHFVLTHPRFVPYLSNLLGEALPEAHIRLCTPEAADMTRVLLAASIKA